MNPEVMRADFERHYPTATKFAAKLEEELEAIVVSNRLSLAVPLESRVKSLGSILDKLERKKHEVTSVRELGDFVGVRAILLFRRDADELCEAIEGHFQVIEQEDVSARLGESEFGYQSRHYLIELPQDWLSVPSLAPLGEYRAELQVRTLAQHMWAAASHHLQYKHERSVPSPLRRSIYRVSALLETVDFEFERLLEERSQYVEKVSDSSPDQELNVDVVAKTLTKMLPEANHEEGAEEYSLLLNELLAAGIRTSAELASLISRRLPEAIQKERNILQALRRAKPDPNLDDLVIANVDGVPYGGESARIRQGVFFDHTGLLRAMLKREEATSRTEQIAED